MDLLLQSALATAAGLLSFLSPCVFPLIPSYLAMLAGSSVKDPEYGSRRNVFLYRSLAFSLGFTSIFIVLGLVFSQASAMISGGSRLWSILAGIIIILLGINMIFDLLSIVNIEKRFHVKTRPTGFFSAFLFGSAFGAGWSPCVGPILASILFMASSGSLVWAALLLGLYSLGLALPFIFTGLFFDKLRRPMDFIKRHMGIVKTVSGILLISIGLFMALGDLRTLSGTFVRLGYILQGLAQSDSGWIIGFVFYLFLSILNILLFFRKRRKVNKYLLLFLGMFFLILAVLEVFRMINTLAFVASWFLFQGI